MTASNCASVPLSYQYNSIKAVLTQDKDNFQIIGLDNNWQWSDDNLLWHTAFQGQKFNANQVIRVAPLDIWADIGEFKSPDNYSGIQAGYKCVYAHKLWVAKYWMPDNTLPGSHQNWTVISDKQPIAQYIFDFGTTTQPPDETPDPEPQQPPPTINTTTIPHAKINMEYSIQPDTKIQVEGNELLFNIVVYGDTPQWLFIDNYGQLYGIPKSNLFDKEQISIQQQFDIMVVDNYGRWDAVSYDITIDNDLGTDGNDNNNNNGNNGNEYAATPPKGEENKYYDVDIMLGEDISNSAMTVSQGKIPKGLVLYRQNNQYRLVGYPAESGNFEFVLSGLLYDTSSKLIYKAFEKSVLLEIAQENKANISNNKFLVAMLNLTNSWGFILVIMVFVLACLILSTIVLIKQCIRLYTKKNKI